MKDKKLCLCVQERLEGGWQKYNTKAGNQILQSWIYPARYSATYLQWRRCVFIGDTRWKYASLIVRHNLYHRWLFVGSHGNIEHTRYESQFDCLDLILTSANKCFPIFVNVIASLKVVFKNVLFFRVEVLTTFSDDHRISRLIERLK